MFTPLKSRRWSEIRPAARIVLAVRNCHGSRFGPVAHVRRRYFDESIAKKGRGEDIDGPITTPLASRKNFPDSPGDKDRDFRRSHRRNSNL